MSITLPEQTQQHIANITEIANGILADLKDLKITSDEEYESLTANLKEVKRVMSDLEAMRTSITKPMNDDLKAVNAQFADPMSRLSFVEKQMKILSADYVVAKRAEQQRILAQAAAASRASAADGVPTSDASVVEFATAIAQAVAAKPPTVAGVSFSEKWEWSVVDASQIPREYLRLDEAKVNGAVKGGLRQIPGLHIFPTTQTRVVAGK